MNNSKEFKINKYLSLRLKDRKTVIYINGRQFRQCIALLLTIPKEEFYNEEGVNSIDEAARFYSHVYHDEINEKGRAYVLTPEQEFFGHCSNLQAWYENDYDTRLLHSNLSFPLLKKLTEVGDPLAKKVYKEEIAKRLSEVYPKTFVLLTRRGYLKCFSEEEREFVYEIIRQKLGEGHYEYLNYFFQERYMNNIDMYKREQVLQDFYHRVKKGNEAVIQFYLEKQKEEWFSFEKVVKCFSELQEFDINVDKVIRREEKWWARRLKRLLKVLSYISLKITVQKRKYRDQIINDYFLPILSRADLPNFALLLAFDCFKELCDGEVERIFKAGNGLDIQKLLSEDEYYYDLIEPLVELLSRPVLKKFGFIKSYKNAFIDWITKNFTTQDYESMSWDIRLIVLCGDKEFKDLLAKKLTTRIHQESDKEHFLQRLIAQNCLHIFTRNQLESFNVKEIGFWEDFGIVEGDLPEEFGYLTSLEKIALECAAVTSFPDSIKNLKKLRELDLGWHESLRSLPVSILTLLNLKKVVLPHYDINFESYKILYYHEGIEKMILEVWADSLLFTFNLIEYKKRLNFNVDELFNLAKAIAKIYDGLYKRTFQFPYEFLDILLRKYKEAKDQKEKQILEEFIHKHLTIFHSFFGYCAHRYAMRFNEDIDNLYDRYGTSLSSFYLTKIKDNFENYTPHEYNSFFVIPYYRMLNEDDLKKLLKDPKLDLINKLDKYIDFEFRRKFKKVHSKWKGIMEKDKLSEYWSFL